MSHGSHAGHDALTQTSTPATSMPTALMAPAGSGSLRFGLQISSGSELPSAPDDFAPFCWAPDFVSTALPSYHLWDFQSLKKEHRTQVLCFTVSWGGSYLDSRKANMEVGEGTPKLTAGRSRCFVAPIHSPSRQGRDTGVLEHTLVDRTFWLGSQLGPALTHSYRAAQDVGPGALAMLAGQGTFLTGVLWA